MEIKESLGFMPDGYITIFKYNKKEFDEFWKTSGARFSKYWGWYYPCNVKDFTLPYGIEAKQLKWEQINNGDNLKSENEILGIIDDILYDNDGSQYIGEIGDEIECTGYIMKAVPIKTKYGDSNFYILDDSVGNHFAWSSTIPLEKNKLYLLNGTVNKHQKYRNQKQTILGKVKIKEVEK